MTHTIKYEFPPRAGITVVVSPLISLMEDQMARLPPPLVGVCLAGRQAASRTADALSRLRSGKCHVLFLSPERLLSASFARLATSSDGLPPVVLCCVDEAHVVTEWGASFRPAYLRLREAIDSVLRARCVLALTATATPKAVQGIKHALALEDDGERIGPWHRPNLRLYASAEGGDGRAHALISILERLDSPLGPVKGRKRSVIVYTSTQREAETTADLIREAGVGGSVAAYHAGLSPSKRDKIQRRFMSGSLPIVCATVAFGLGLDKRDVRGVVHWGVPTSLEAYLQQCGRAGRDGLPATAIALVGDPDAARFSISRAASSAPTLEQTQALFIALQNTALRLAHRAHFLNLDTHQLQTSSKSMFSGDGRNETSSKSMFSGGGRDATSSKSMFSGGGRDETSSKSMFSGGGRDATSSKSMFSGDGRDETSSKSMFSGGGRDETSSKSMFSGDGRDEDEEEEVHEPPSKYTSSKPLVDVSVLNDQLVSVDLTWAASALDLTPEATETLLCYAAQDSDAISLEPSHFAMCDVTLRRRSVSEAARLSRLLSFAAGLGAAVTPDDLHEVERATAATMTSTFLDFGKRPQENGLEDSTFSGDFSSSSSSKKPQFSGGLPSSSSSSSLERRYGLAYMRCRGRIWRTENGQWCVRVYLAEVSSALRWTIPAVQRALFQLSDAGEASLRWRRWSIGVRVKVSDGRFGTVESVLKLAQRAYERVERLRKEELGRALLAWRVLAAAAAPSYADALHLSQDSAASHADVTGEIEMENIRQALRANEEDDPYLDTALRDTTAQLEEEEEDETAKKQVDFEEEDEEDEDETAKQQVDFEDEEEEEETAKKQVDFEEEEEEEETTKKLVEKDGLDFLVGAYFDGRLSASDAFLNADEVEDKDHVVHMLAASPVTRNLSDTEREHVMRTAYGLACQMRQSVASASSPPRALMSAVRRANAAVPDLVDGCLGGVEEEEELLSWRSSTLLSGGAWRRVSLWQEDDEDAVGIAHSPARDLSQSLRDYIQNHCHTSIGAFLLHTLAGPRAVAKAMHGVGSGLFPAAEWRFRAPLEWARATHVDFDTCQTIAQQQIRDIQQQIRDIQQQNTNKIPKT